MSWISVKDRLPEENVSVLVFIPEEDNHITTGMWDVSKKWVLLDEYRAAKSQVTYWHEMIEKPSDVSYEPSHFRYSEDDTLSNTIRSLQKTNYEFEKAIKQAKEALQKAENTIHRLYTYADMPPEDKSGWLKELRQALETINKLGI